MRCSSLGDRLTVPGVDSATMRRLDWQPIGMERLLTTVVAGIPKDQRLSFAFEVLFESGG